MKCFGMGGIGKAPAAQFLAQLFAMTTEACSDAARTMKFLHLPPEAIAKAYCRNRHLDHMGQIALIYQWSGAADIMSE